MDTEWFYAKGEHTLGPLSWDLLKQLAAAGQLLPTDRVRPKGIQVWIEAKAVEGLFDGQSSAIPPGRKAPPSPGSSPKPISGPVAAVPAPPPVSLAQRAEADACFRKAQVDFTRCFYDQAIAGYTEALRLNPQHALAFVQRAAAYFYQHAYDRVVADCTEAIRIDPRLPEAYHNRGYAFFYLGQHDRAVADLTEALRLNPKLNGTSEMLRKAQTKAEEEQKTRKTYVHQGQSGKADGSDWAEGGAVHHAKTVLKPEGSANSPNLHEAWKYIIWVLLVFIPLMCVGRMLEKGRLNPEDLRKNTAIKKAISEAEKDTAQGW